MIGDETKKEWQEIGVSIEGSANSRRMREYLHPLLIRMADEPLKDIKLLSVGCGFGADVDTLTQLGINAYGVEPFRSLVKWASGEVKGRLLRADGKNLPFNNEVFDIVYCSEVIEHIGYTKRVKNSTVKQEREIFATELTRVLKTEGSIILTTPNKHFCIDYGHGANFLGLRIHSPFESFTLSRKEIENIFVRKNDCRMITNLPYKNLISWNLWLEEQSKIQFLLPLVKIYLSLLDRLPFLRGTFLSPYLILAIKK